MNGTVEKIDYQQGFWDILGMVWRRKFFIIIPIIIGAFVSIYLIKTLPKIYESSTLILVEGQKVPDSIVKSAVTGSAQDRLLTIKQQILSRSFLQKIVDKFELYQGGELSFLYNIAGHFGISLEPSPMKTSSLEDKLDRMRKNITINTRGKRRLDSFTIIYTGEDPETVMNVTNELAASVIEQNLKIRESFVEGATDFLIRELGQIKIELEKQEAVIGDYKRRHIGELPGQLDANLQSLDRFQANLDSIELSKKSSRDRVADLERMLGAAKRKLAQVIRATSLGVLRVPVKKEVLLPLPSLLVKKLTARRQELTNMLAEYSEDYPDVGVLRRNIRQLENQLAQEEIDQDLEQLGGVEGSGGFGLSVSDEKGEAEVDAAAEALMVLHEQIENERNAFNNFLKKEQKIHRQIRLYERRVENTPRREQEMVIMSRDYDNLAANYQSLLNKKMSAQISENLEKSQKGEQFRIIDSANLPERPVSPGALVIVLLGVVGGLGVGIGLVYLREMLDNSIRNPEEVERITSVLVLAEIPDFSEAVVKSKKVIDLEAFSDRKKQLRRQGMKG